MYIKTILQAVFQNKDKRIWLFFKNLYLGNPLNCDCEMRWYKRWYNDGWQEVDEDHIRETFCSDPYDGKEHNIAKVPIL